MITQNFPTISSLELKPVFGEGREARWESVQKILREKIAPLSGSQEELIQILASRVDGLKCRLLLADTNPAGLLIYKTTLRDCHGWASCLEIITLYADDQEKSEISKPLSTFLLKEVTISAKEEWKASSFCISVPKKAEQMLAFFKQNQFKVIKEQETLALLGKKLIISLRSPEKSLEKTKEIASEEPKEILHKRKREDKPLEPSKRAKIMETFQSQQSLGKQQPTNQMDECPVQKKYFNMIREGSKTIEGRINCHPFTNWHENQEIRFKNGQDFILCKIVKMTVYDTFHTMLHSEGYTHCIPDARSLDEAVDIYHKIPNYTYKERQYGVLAIQIKLIGGL